MVSAGGRRIGISLLRSVMAALIATTALVAPAASASADTGAGSVGGTVTVPGGHDVTGVDLYLASANGSSVVAGPVSPDGTGAYEFASLADGDYTVFAETPSDTLAWQWSGSGRDAGEASTVTVSGGAATTGVDFALVAGASISGTITVPSGYSPEDSGAFADRPSGSATLAPPGTATAAGQYTFAASDGSYTIAGLPDLTWLVRFPTTGQWLATEYYNGASTVGAATTLSPSAGEALTGIDATLEETHNLRITGTFKDAGSSLCYAYHNADSSVTGSDCTAAGVAEASILVKGGDYIVSAYESNATHGDTPTLWWNATATDETVEANATAFTPDPLSADLPAAAAFDFTGLLWPGDPIPGGINFTLTNWSDGSPATGGCMQVFDSSQTQVAQDCTGYAGTYRVGPLDDGAYRVKFAGFDGAAPQQYYGPAPSFGGGTDIVMTGGTVTLDAVLLQPHGLIGSVKDASAQPLTGGFVEIWDSTVFTAPVTRVAVGADGKWATGQLSCTYCLIRMTGFAGLADEWWGAGSPKTSSAAQSVVPSATYPSSPTAHTLDLVPGTLSGTIVKPTSFVGDTTCVVLYESGSSGRPLGTSCGNAGDSFEFDGLPATNYGVCVADTVDPTVGCTGSSYLWDFVGGATPGTATSFAVTAGSTTTAALAFGGTITASATDLFGTTVTGGCVDAYAATTSALLGSDCTDDAGVYSIAVGADSNTVGSYRIHFRDFPGFADQWYSDAASLAEATAVSVEAEGTTTLPAVTLLSTSTDGSVTFDLTNWGSGTAATGGCMQVYDASNSLVGEDCAGAAGTYAVTGLGDGLYRVLLANFDGAAPTQWYGPAAAFAQASPITIAGGTHFAGTYTVLQPSSIAGKVTDSSGNPLTGGRVEVWSTGYSLTVPLAGAAVAADGSFATGSVLCASCRVRFAGFDGLADEWYLNAASLTSATTVATSAATPKVLSTAVIDSPPGTLSGIIVVPSNFSGDTACVVVYERYYVFVIATACGAPGEAFSITGLPATTYTVCVADTGAPTSGCSGTDYLWDFVGGSNVVSGERFGVSPGATTVASLAFGGTITSTPTVTGGGTLAGGCMDVYADTSGPLIGSDCSPVDGSFSVSVGTDSEAYFGGYKVHFRDFTGGLDEWYNNRSSQSSATSVTVRSGQAVPLSIELTPWGTISGTITLPDGVSPDGACVFAFDASGTSGDGPVTSTACSDPETGSYSMPIAPGTYDLMFFGLDSGVATEWYDGASARAQATSVTVTSGNTTSVNASLGAAAQISGTVNLSGGGTSSDGSVDVYTTDGDIVTEVSVDGSGHYSITDLPAGSYNVYFTGYGSWTGQWYNATQFWDAATDVTLAAGDAVDISPTLDAVATLSGVVTATAGGPATGGCVELFDDEGSNFIELCVDETGAYSGTVAPGTYRLLFTGFNDGSGGTLASEWSGNGDSYVTASTITLTPGGATVANAALASGGKVSGSTTVSGSTAAALGGCVSARDPETYVLVDFWCDVDAGTYEMHLLPGQYLLRLDRFSTASGTSLLDTWYSGATVPSMATPVTITHGGSVTVNASIPYEGSFYGTVVLPVGAQMDGSIEVYDSATGTFIRSLTPDPDGSYRVDGLISGHSYKAVFVGFTGAANVWYTTAATWRTASTVAPLAAGRNMGSQTLAAEGVITGVFPVLPGFVGTDICATAYYGDNYYVNDACGTVGESFAMYNLPAGNYFVEYSDNHGHTAYYSTNSDLTYVSYIYVTAGSTSDIANVSVTVSGPSTMPLGSTATLEVTVDPAISSTGALQYQYPDGAWKTSTTTVSIYRGAGSVSFGQSAPEMSYRVVLGDSVSNVITIDLQTPTVTVDGPTTLAPGGRATLDVSVDPASSGTGKLQYQYPDGAWKTSSATVPSQRGGVGLVRSVRAGDVVSGGVRWWYVERHHD